MKRLLFVLSFLVISSMAFAQVNGGLQGPAAKNYKYWLDKNKPVATEIVTTDKEPLQGPAAKNIKWYSQSVDNKYIAIETVTARPRVIGPNAKHARPYHFRHMRLVSDNSNEGQDNLSSRKD